MHENHLAYVLFARGQYFLTVYLLYFLYKGPDARRIPRVAYIGCIYADKIPATAIFDLSDHHPDWDTCPEPLFEHHYSPRPRYCADIVPDINHVSDGLPYDDRRIYDHEVFV